MSVAAIIYLVILLGFLIGTFIFFIIMDLKKHKKESHQKSKNELDASAEDEDENNERLKK